MYTYYNKVKSEEHMLYASEIAILFGINSENDKPHSAFVSSALKEYIDLNVEGYIPLYYINNRGKANEVYPQWIYAEVIINLCRQMIIRDSLYMIRINNKNYKVKRVEV